MSFKDSMTGGVASDDQINKHYKSLLDDTLDIMDSKGKDLSDIPHNNPNHLSATSDNGVMKSNLMTWTTMLEAMNCIMEHMVDPRIYQNMEDLPVSNDSPESSSYDEKELMDELNKIFTPVLVSQKFERDISDQKNDALSEAAVLTEKNIISFDDETRMSQLINVCAKLIAQKKNTEQWQMFKKAAAIKKQASVNIQKEEYDEAKNLAQKYLAMVSTTNNSSVARDAASELLPQTQH